MNPITLLLTLQSFRAVVVRYLADRAPELESAFRQFDAACEELKARYMDEATKINKQPERESTNTIATHGFDAQGQNTLIAVRGSTDIPRDYHVMETAIELYYAAVVRKQTNVTPLLLWKHIMGSEFRTPPDTDPDFGMTFLRDIYEQLRLAWHDQNTAHPGTRHFGLESALHRLANMLGEIPSPWWQEPGQKLPQLAKQGESLGAPYPDYPEWCKTYRERLAYQHGVADGRAYIPGGLSSYPALVAPHVFQYAEELFVAFDPTDGGSSVLGAWRMKSEAVEATQTAAAGPVTSGEPA